MARMLFVFLMAMLLNSLKASAQLRFQPAIDTAAKKISIRPLPQNFYSQHAGYFCKKEWQLQKKTSLPLYLRLGSKDYVDFIEKKPNAKPGLHR